MKKIFILLFALIFSFGVSAAETDNISVDESTVTFTTAKQIRQMSVYSLVGGCVLTQKSSSNMITISDLPKGFYLLKVFTDKGIMTYKFMKN